MDGAADQPTDVLMAGAAPAAGDAAAVRMRAALRARLVADEPVPGVGRYVLGERLGAGGMGVVVAARDPELGREVAIKFIPLADADHERLLREARAMASIEHRNVVPVYDVGTQGDELYVVMALMDGGTLGEWAARETPNRSALLARLIEAGHGLAAAHRAGVVHHDFKPGNVLLAADGHAAVADFGLASTVEYSSVASQVSSETSRESSAAVSCIGGTPGYEAPERAAGEPGDARSDQYSFCVTATVVLASSVDRAPNPENAIAIAEALADAGIDHVGATLLRGLQPDPAMRFASMDALLADLQPRRRGRHVAGAAIATGVLASAALLAWPNLPTETAAAVAAPDLSVLETHPTAADPTTDALLRLVAASQNQPEVRNAYQQLAWTRLDSATDAHTKARLHLSLGTVALTRLQDSTAQRHLLSAAQLADQAGADEVAMRAHTNLARALVDHEPSRALESVRFANAALGRLDPPPAAAVFELALNEAFVHQALGEHDAALAAVDRAIALGEEHPVPRSYNAPLTRCTLKMMQGDYGEAARSCTRALDQAVAAGASERDVLPIRGNLMTAAMGMGDLPRAVAEGEALSPIVVAEHGPDGLVVVEHRVNLIDLYLAKNDNVAAKRMLQENLESLECCHPGAYAQRATNYAGFGYLELSGDVQLAKRWYSKALVEMESNGAASHPKTVKYRAQLSFVERQLGSYVRARRHADAAVESARAIGPTANDGLSLALSYRAGLSMLEERFEDAREDLLESLDAGMGTRESPHPTQAPVVEKLARVESALGNRAEARRLLGQMLATLDEAGLGDSRHAAGCQGALAEIEAGPLTELD